MDGCSNHCPDPKNIADDRRKDADIKLQDEGKNGADVLSSLSALQALQALNTLATQGHSPKSEPIQHSLPERQKAGLEAFDSGYSDRCGPIDVCVPSCFRSPWLGAVLTYSLKSNCIGLALHLDQIQAYILTLLRADREMHTKIRPIQR
jgi:hypothetical protein